MQIYKHIYTPMYVQIHISAKFKICSLLASCFPRSCISQTATMNQQYIKIPIPLHPCQHNLTLSNYLLVTAF